MRIFDEPTSQWNTERLRFVEWLMFYDRVYNVPEGPPEQKIIDDDVLLDRWIKEYNLKRKQDRLVRRSGGGKPTSAKDHKHVIKFSPKE